LEEETDLRPYIEALISKWYWLVGAAVVAGIVAFVVSSFLPPSYEATALVAVTQPTEIVEFDSRIRSVDDNQPLEAYPEIALSDELMLGLLPEVSAMASDIQSVEDVRGLLEAAAGADPSLLRLTVTHGDPDKTAAIANLWAELFVTRANEIYGNQGGEQLAFFQEQLAEAELELAEAEEALIEFQARNRSEILNNQLQALQQTQANQLGKREEIESILQDVQGLLVQVETGSTYGAQLAALLLQVRTFGGGQQGSAETAVRPWAIQVDATQANDRTPSEQAAALAGLQSTLSSQLQAVRSTLTDLEPQILAVQQSKQEAETENARLVRNYTLAEETYSALASKVEEERITSRDVNSGVKLVGKTAVPSEPTKPSLFLNVLVAMMLGFAIGIVFVLYKFVNN
jgi:uncharacterized protein involved in exopolysaccharide biosynthesis